MQTKNDKRLLDPEQIHQIWLGIINEMLKSCENKQNLTKEKLSSLLCNSKDGNGLTDSDAKQIVDQAIKEGLIDLLNSENNKVSNGIDYNFDDELIVTLPKNVPRITQDWYCVECHQCANDEELLECDQCWRLYHKNCTKKLFESIAGIVPQHDTTDIEYDLEKSPCPICKLSQFYSNKCIGSRQFDQKEFNEILSYTYSRFKSKSSISSNLTKLKQLTTKEQLDLLNNSISLTSFTNSENHDFNTKNILTQLAYQFLVYKPVHLEDIEHKLSNSLYETIGEFFGDCHSLIHMVELTVIANGEQTSSNRRRLKDASARMLEATRYDLKEMIGCVDCYRNSNRQEVDKFWFCRPCVPPHMLVFAKQKGFSYWPAKVIYPKGVVDIDLCSQFDVRFFGSNHERSLIDKSNIKDINSSLSELNITKPISALEKALAELRTHRDLLENNDTTIEQIDKSKAIIGVSSRRSSTNSEKRKARSFSTDRRSNRTSTETASDTEHGNSDTEIESDLGPDASIRRSKRKRVSLIKNNRGKLYRVSRDELDSENDTELDSEKLNRPCSRIDEENKTDVDNEDLVENSLTDDDSKDAVQSQINTDIDENSNSSVKKSRGRPSKTMKHKCVVTGRSPKKSRVRRQKVLYSPQSNDKQSKQESVSQPQSTYLASTTSKRGRKPKSVETNAPSLTPTTNPQVRLRQCRTAPSPAINIYTPDFNKRKSFVSTSRKKPPKISPSSKSSHKYHKRKSNLERQRQLLQARKKLKFQKEHEIKDSLKPKHIPPVTATKSLPKFISANPVKNINPLSISKIAQPILPRPILKPILNSTYPSGHNMQVQQMNGYLNNYPQMQYPTCDNNYVYGYVKIEGENGDSTINLLENQEDFPTEIQLIPQEQYNLETFKPPSSILRPLINGEVKEDNNVDDDLTLELMKIESSKSNNLNGDSNGVDSLKNKAVDSKTVSDIQETSSPFNSSDGTENLDNEPYQYNDEQLQEEINYYLEYTNEQEKLAQQLPLQNIRQSLPNGITNSHQPLPKPIHKTNGFFDAIPIKNYIEFSSNSVYSPTKKNQKLVNSYLHHINHSTLHNQKNDFLAQLVLRKDELETEQVDISSSPKKRGRPPKGSEKSGDSFLEKTVKAKSILEKSYLQDSACNRSCLTNNMKSFKKFRDFVEFQSKTEMSKLKREIEDLKQQVYRLENKHKDVLEELKEERESIKRRDPEIVKELEKRHRATISEIKRKQWCIVCEAEAQFICCYNTNYCSPQCQHKHWLTGHQNSCGRVRLKNASLNRKTTIIKQCK